MKKSNILISIVSIVLLSISTYSLFMVQSYKKEITNLKQSKKQAIEELNRQENISKELKEEVNKNMKLLTNITKDLEKSNKKIEEMEADKKIVEQSTGSNHNNQSSETPVNSGELTGNQENYINDPVAERDAFSAQFKEKYGRAPSSGEIQMEWLRKQGLVE